MGLVLTAVVDHVPVAQPRHRASCRGGFARMYLPTDHPVHAFKQAVKTAIREQAPRLQVQAGPLKLSVLFRFRATRKVQRGTARTERPDLDNLLKAVMDAMTEARVWHDDAQVTTIEATKMRDEVPGVSILLRTVPDGEL